MLIRGCVVPTMWQETGARLVFSNRNDYFPETKYRVPGSESADEPPLCGVYGEGHRLPCQGHGNLC